MGARAVENRTKKGGGRFPKKWEMRKKGELTLRRKQVKNTGVKNGLYQPGKNGLGATPDQDLIRKGKGEK